MMRVVVLSSFFLKAVVGDCKAASGIAQIRAEVTQLGKAASAGYACASSCSVSAGSACALTGWACLLQDSNSKSSYCTQTCSSNSDCPSGSSCNTGAVAITIAKLGICMQAFDSSVPLTSLGVMSAPEQQRFNPGTAMTLVATNNQFDFLTKSLAESLTKLQSNKGLDSDPDMVAIRVMLAELIRLHPHSQKVNENGGKGPLSEIETDIDITVHNILHPVSFMIDGVPGSIWDVEHPFEKDSAYILVRGAVVAFFWYALIGICLKSYFEGATGVNRFPHLAFWLDFPQLVRDGLHFAQVKVNNVSGSNYSFPDLLAKARDSKYLSARDSFANFEPLN